MWGTSGFVKSSAEESKKSFNWASLVLGENGIAAKKWQLKAKSSLIVVLGKASNVLFVHEGALSVGETDVVILNIKNQIKAS